MFTVDPAFDLTSTHLGALALSDARLQLDARFPWIVLIPRRVGAGGLDDLAESDHRRLMAEILAAGRAARAVADVAGAPTARLNIGILGNITPQLHVHVASRRPDDAAWPGPVWGHGQAIAYDASTRATAIAAARAALGL